MAAMTRRAGTVIAAFVAGAVIAGGTAVAVESHHDDTSSTGHPGSVDVGFAQDMSVHHEQAVLMAGLALTHGTRAVRPLADAILVNQSQEIGLTRGWLRLWAEPAVDPHPMAWMGAVAMRSMTMTPGSSGSSMSTDSMPGMASPDQLNHLYGVTGKTFDKLFLQLMIRHHLGGIEMARVAVDRAMLPAVRAAARSMIVEQVEDLGTMRALLAADGGTELPAP
jgi:uncharacterized protein (DUF305 family)